MANGMNQDEKNLHEFFKECHDAYQSHNLEDAKAGVKLFMEELNEGCGKYGLVFYVKATLAGFQLFEAIEAAAESKEVA